MEENEDYETWSSCEEYGHNWYDDEIPHRCADCGYQEEM